MNDIPRIQPHDLACPSCGYIIAGMVRLKARMDYDCPVCHDRKLSEFTALQSRGHWDGKAETQNRGSKNDR